MSSSTKTAKRSIILATVSTLAGFCNSLLGAGGGLFLSLTMGRFLLKDGENGSFSGKALDRRDILATSQAAMIPGCALSCLIYAQGGLLDTTNFSVFAIPAVIGGGVGAWLLSRIDAKWIARIFAALVTWSGLRMLLV